MIARMNTFASIRTVLALVATLLLGVTALVLAPAALADGELPHLRAPADSSDSTKDYWTKQRMLSAEPLQPPVISGDAPSRSELEAAAPPASEPSSFDPDNVRLGQAPAGVPKSRAAAFGSGPVPLALYGTYPITTNGRIFGKFRGIGRYSCSGTVVATRSDSVVLTAGHCIHDARAGFASKLIFVPSYLAGNAPNGTWIARYAAVSRGWFTKGNNNYDWGAMKMRSPKRKLGKVVGEVGLAYNQPRPLGVAAVGYPSNLGGGQIMWACFGALAGVDAIERDPGPPATGIGCNMGPGASGGGWFINYGLGPLLNSVSSYLYRDIPNTIFGPYFGRKVLRVINSANRH